MNDNAHRWVEALRSGDYQQGTQALRTGDRFCCLGVACDLYRKETGEGHWETEIEGSPSTFGLGGQWQMGSLLPEVARWLGLGSMHGQFTNRVGPIGYNCLTGLNDSGYSFDEIADHIESEPKGLFK